MLIQIARFEFRYLLRNPLLWLTSLLTFALFFFAISLSFELGSEGGLLENATYATLRNHMTVSMIFMFVTTSFVANAVIRDDETGFGPIVRSTRISKADYVFGRYLGAFAVAATCMLLVPIAISLGALMPWADPADIGPIRLADYLFAYFVIALPNLFVHSAVLFALATITRSMMATYLGVVVFACGFFMLQDAFRRPQADMALALAEPFGSRALREATRYWTVAERNTTLPELSGALLYNRLLWTGIALVSLGLAYAAYRFSERGASKRERKQQKLAKAATLSPEARPHDGLVLPSPRHDTAALLALLWMRTRFEARQVMKNTPFVLLLAWGVYSTLFALTHRYPDFMPEYPTTLSLIPEIEEAFQVMLLVVAIYFSGDLVWRERDRRVHEMIDAAPLPNWAYVVPKTAAMALVLLALLAINVLAAVGLQLSHGFTDVELGKYVLWYVLPESFDVLLLAALAIFVQALCPHKAVGWGIMTIFLLWLKLNELKRWLNHHLLNFAETPSMPLSDLNGAGSFWIGAWALRLYWGAFAVLLLVGAHLLWRRGTEIRLKPRLASARRRLAGTPGLVAGAALLTFAATGAYAYYNTNVLNEYQTKEGKEAAVAEYERRFGKYSDLPHPSLEELTLDISLEPAERRAVTKGRYLLRNLTAQPITDLHVRLADTGGLELTGVAFPAHAGARLIVDDREYDHRIYRLARPMQPGEALPLTFETRRWLRGFKNGPQETTLVENGTFITESELMPLVGMSYNAVHHDPEIRRKYGLPELPGPPRLEDVSATWKMSFDNSLMKKSDITLSTDAGQTPIAPGKKVSDVTRDGRRTARFVTTAPTRPRFSVQSARYAEKHRRYVPRRGSPPAVPVDLVVYYHPRHAWNVDRMLDAMAASLDYYQANFGPYQFDHFRVVEFPAYHNYAQAFAGTIAFSESVGFISEYNEEDTLDLVSGMIAHELAHQYWPNQMMGAEMEGYTFFVETLAQYSTYLVMKQLRGEDQIRRYLQYDLDRYLWGRSGEKEEPPLARVLGQDYLSYRKGPLALHLLTKRLGDDAVNRALRNMLARYKFKPAPYPRTLDFIAALRAEAKTAEEQNLITDLFERVTLYDLKVTEPTATPRADGRWDVTVPIEAKKFYVTGEAVETETPLDERIEIGLFTAEPGAGIFDKSHVLLMERHPIRSGKQVLQFISERKPLYAGVDPYNFYIDRVSWDNVGEVGG
ncbi:MAG TPA: M1 family aminopeptidase [Thermoanaerobaculia bacterium]|jgi:ABC-type transport system involved in multi-copper enzyme maturation permease subunit